MSDSSPTDPGDRRREWQDLPPPIGSGPRPGATWGRFQVECLLGQGGMGRVWRAFDPQLQRLVALKTLRTDDPRAAERLGLEARAQARVEHESVCKVYEVGEVGGAPYIAMQLIAGRGLKEATAGLSVEQKVAVLHQVALGVHAAHRTGLIHRDLKPSNILAEAAANGDLHPYVLDFGVARDVDGAGLTRTGLAVGSILYMAPEQAMGQPVDRRVDVWGLGATLYELLAGAPPFAGGGETEVLMRLLGEEPPVLGRRVQGLPRDLSTVVMKCLERAPERRYESALDFAADLQHYLDGEPVTARPAHWMYRTSRRMMRHRGLAAVVAASLVAIAALLGLTWRSHWQAERTAIAAQRFGREVQEIQNALRVASLLPLHDIRPDRARVVRQMQEVRDQMREFGDLARGPGHFALGRVLLALNRLEEAQAEIERAIQAGYGGPDVSFALGRVLAERYQRGVEDASQLNDPELRRTHQREVEQAYLQPARAALRSSGGVAGEGRAYLLALLALCEQRYTDAARLAERAFRDDPSRFEAEILLGDIELQTAREDLERGDYKRVDEEVAAARHVYAGAAEVARSSPEVRAGLCRLEVVAIDLDRARGAPLPAHEPALLAACGKALVAVPGESQSLAAEAHGYVRFGEAARERGGDAATAYRRAIALANAALASDARNTEALLLLSVAELRLGQMEGAQGRDPRPWFDRSRHSAERIVAVAPGFADGYSTLAFVQLALGEAEIGEGADPTAALDDAIHRCRQGIALAPELANLHHRLAYALFQKATDASLRGGDPRPLLAQSEASYQRTLAINPRTTSAYSNLGNAYQMAAEYEIDHGLPAATELNAAIEQYRRSLALQPDYETSHQNLGAAFILRGLMESKHDLDPRPSFGLARAELEASATLNPTDAFSFANLAQMAEYLAEYLLRRDQSPVEAIAEGGRQAAKSLSINPNDPDVVRTRAELDLLTARWRSRQGTTATDSFAASERSLARSLALNPKDARTWVDIAQLAEARCEAVPSATEVLAPAGLAAARKAVGLNAQLAAAEEVRGRLALRIARASSAAARRQAASEAAAALANAQRLDRGLAATLAEPLRAARSLAQP